MGPKKNCTSTERQLIATLRKQVDELKTEWMRHEGERIQLAVRHTDLMSHWNSISGTYAGAVRQKNETIQRMLVEAGFIVPTSDDPHYINDENEIRNIALQSIDKAQQTELW